MVNKSGDGFKKNQRSFKCKLCYLNIENVSISLQGLYKINAQWEVSPKFTYYFKKDYTTYSSLDFDGHYVLSDNGFNAFYALAGLNITFFKYKYDGPSYSEG